MEEIDLVIIGAGFHGLIAAKTCLDVYPSTRVIIYDSASSIGGVWAKENLYPGLKTNNMLGTYEFSDYPMDSETYGVKKGEHIPGAVVHHYLTNFTKHFGIYEKVRLETKVESAEHCDGGGWIVTTSSSSSSTLTSSTVLHTDEAKKSRVLASKLIVATGLTTDPVIPIFEGSVDFKAPILHSKYFARNLDSLENAERVTVLGGMKSAFDVAYAYAEMGVQVEMIIRESGHGPMWIAPPYATPFKLQVEKVITTRLITCFSPCIWDFESGYKTIRPFLHTTALGRYFVSKFWSTLESDIHYLNSYDSHPETTKLKPWTKILFIGSINGVLNYEKDFFELVRSGIVRVHISDIASLDRKTVRLTNGESLESDALVCCTGWKHTPPLTFLPNGIETKVGLPHPIDAATENISPLERRADEEILSRFPSLRDQPPRNPKGKQLPGVPSTEGMSSYQLYRFIVPPSFICTRDIAFAGHMLSILTPTRAQIQALWITAFFSGELPKFKAPLEGERMEVQYETVPQGWGGRFPESVFEEVAYFDVLLGDLGCEIWRKRGS
ncbi:hypothetical protein BKA65DRAFT_526954 [Rhexocercosporidium sp. MPI-PUGE-AT-0058]|nr:hypothetical protein BKA65DRAFT_526954 [Rhexocercosporidium sp. MPI-PUGE-AT-0058]